MPINQLISALETDLDLTNLTLSQEFRYRNLFSCLVDSIFSIGVQYSSVTRTVHSYWKNSLAIDCDSKFPDCLYDLSDSEIRADESSIQNFLSDFGSINSEVLADTIFDNRQRTSSMNGILKAQAVRDAAALFAELKLTTFHSMHLLLKDASRLFEVERRFRQIKGQASGISFKYLLMLAGSDNHIKPDRMVLRYVESALRSQMDIEQSETLFLQAAAQLKKKYDHITPRLLDYAVWSYQRSIAPKVLVPKVVVDTIGGTQGKYKLKVVFTDPTVQGQFLLDRVDLDDLLPFIATLGENKILDWGGRKGQTESVKIDFEQKVVKFLVRLLNA